MALSRPKRSLRASPMRSKQTFKTSYIAIKEEGLFCGVKAQE
jgi:hypothetical protein